MPIKFEPGCKRPTIKKDLEKIQEKTEIIKGEEKSMIQVGKAAPLFSAPGYYEKEFQVFDLNEYKGKWVMLCFYPGDFTYV